MTDVFELYEGPLMDEKERNVYCTICDCTIRKRGKSAHLNTIKHATNLEKKESEEVKENQEVQEENEEKEEQEECPICYTELNYRNMAPLPCGHDHCVDCENKISHCSLCRKKIRIASLIQRLYDFDETIMNRIRINRMNIQHANWENLYQYAFDLSRIKTVISNEYERFILQAKNNRETVKVQQTFYCLRLAFGYSDDILHEKSASAYNDEYFFD